MGRLHDLHLVGGQSPWLDNLRRSYLTGGELTARVESGIRGVTSNPSIFQKAIAESDDYDEQFASLLADGVSVEDAYWRLVVDDIDAAARILEPIHGESGGVDGWVSVEVDPRLAHDTAGTIEAALALRARLTSPNVMIKVPATSAGLPAIRSLVGAGVSVNVTLIFSVPRYADVVDAYLGGLEDLVDAGGEVSAVHGVASFFVSRTDSEIDNRLHAIGTDDALLLRGQAAVAQAQVAYQHFRRSFEGPRWERLASLGANLQRPLWASTSTKNPAYPDTLYVDTLIGPNTVNTLPEPTVAAFVERGTVARTVDADPAAAEALLAALAEVGIDLADVAAVLEREGVSSFERSFVDLLQTLSDKAAALAG